MSIHGLNIAHIRKDYRLAELDESTVGDDPLAFFGKWFADANEAKVSEVNAMILATVDAHNHPHARIVLLKEIDPKGFVFYSNYDSDKGQQMHNNPHVALNFFWKELERQVRIEGTIEKVSDEESNIYFSTRPEGSRIGAWASPQSKIIADRSILEENYNSFEKKFADGIIPRPTHWGGYRVLPVSIEFWQGRSNRLHDRILFTQQSGEWSKCRLAP